MANGETRAERYTRWAEESARLAAECWAWAARVACSLRTELGVRSPDDGYLDTLRSMLATAQNAAIGHDFTAQLWSDRAAEVAAPNGWTTAEI